jgi:hypothetical protein
MIYETDTDMLAIWNGTAWRYIAATTPTNGSVLQVVSNTTTDKSSYSNTAAYTQLTGLTATITPKSTSSKVLVSSSFNIGVNNTDDTWFQLTRNGTAIGVGSGGSTENATTYLRGIGEDGTYSTLHVWCMSIQHMDSPSSTSSLTYAIQGKPRTGSFFLNRRAGDANFAFISSITAMEIAG